MQLKIYIDLNENNLTLPLNYNHIIQGIIYSSLSNDTEYQKTLHNEGITLGENYKLFSFSSLCGNHTISNKMITFIDNVFLEIRSVDSYFIFLVYEYMKQNGITFGNRKLYPNLKLENKIIQENNITIKMNSPICVFKKNLENNNTIYLSPRDSEFETAINNNFIRKYSSYYCIEPYSDILITNINLSPKDKVVTNIKKIYITSWKGEYVLEGSPDYLTFLYNAGLGSKNSQGFGLFEIIE